MTSNTLTFQAKTLGTASYTMSKAGALYHTVYVTVKEPSYTQQYNITIEK